MKREIVEVRWCQACGNEYPADQGAMCKCGSENTVSLGWRVGNHKGEYSYYSTWNTIPKKDKENRT